MALALKAETENTGFCQHHLNLQIKGSTAQIFTAITTSVP